MVSVICCYNDFEVYNKMLYTSILKQRNDYEIIALDNTDGRFTSAAQALNYGASIANGDYLVFVHQDIEFYQDNFLESLENYLEDLLNEAIIGIAGMKDASEVYSNLIHGSNRERPGKFSVEKPMEMQTLDECLFAMKKSTYAKLKFDELTCYNWHLYAVDICLAAKLVGIKSYVVPLDAYHKSPGVVSKAYKKNLNKLLKKYRKSYKVVYTTCSVSYTNYFVNFYIKLKNKLNKIFRLYILKKV